jgi:hypothetical protein
MTKIWLHIFLNKSIFLIRKSGDIRKMMTEKEMIRQLKAGSVTLPPLTIRLLETEKNFNENVWFDALVEAKWRKSVIKYLVECKAMSTPKAFVGALNFFKTVSLPSGYLPMLFMPYLSDQRLQQLEQEGISGIDLCGNGIIIAPDKLLVYRSGEKNKFSSSAPIRNIYRLNSSMVGRVFLARPKYTAVQEILDEINQRNVLVTLWEKKAMSLSTVSKSLKTLEDDLIIGRNEFIRLLQPEKLLDKLNENYRSPKIRERVSLKIPIEESKIQKYLLAKATELQIPIVATGLSSVTKIAVMQREKILSVYCPRLRDFLKGMDGSRSARFPNIEFIETEEENVYFDARQDEDFWWASPSQVYFELMAGDKRDQETANQVKVYILKMLREVNQ